MIYTCYDMVRDCRAGRAEGWSYFICSYSPAIRKLIDRYFPQRVGDDRLLQQVLSGICRAESSMFQSLEPAPERWFVAELRQNVLTLVEALEAAPAPETEIDLDTMTTALDGLTLVEKQSVWLETMRYSPEETGTLLRMDPRTVEKIRERAAGLVRGKVETWSRSLLEDNGAQLGRAAAAGKTENCLPAKAFLDILDGRTTWLGREQMERHVSGCWHCIDHFCRLTEVVELLRGLQPLSHAESERFRQHLGIELKAKPVWKRWFGARKSLLATSYDKK